MTPIPWRELYNLNKSVVGSNPDLIYPGQVLVFPDGTKYTVVPGDYLSKIAAGNGGGTYEEQKSDEDAQPPEDDAESSPEDDAAEPAPETPPAPPPQKNTKPGRRTFNPLSFMTSYTYHITLYMITPEAYNDFVINGEADPKQFHIIAESGGTNRDGKNTRVTAMDFYIDDLSFKTMASTKHTNGPVTDTTEFNFKIFEPYGFSLASIMKQATYKVMSESPLQAAAGQTVHHMSQIYMLGIKFYGYGKDGTLYTSDALKSDTGFGSKSTTSDVSVKYNLFPKYYPITITEMKFKLDGKITTYNVKAIGKKVNTAMGTLTNQVAKGYELEGGTVEEVLTGKVNGVAKNKRNLIDTLNAEEAKLRTGANPTTSSNHYAIEFDEGATLIKTALMVGPETNKKKTAVSKVDKTSDVNDKTSSKTVAFDTRKRTVSVNNGITITQIIDQVIGISSYVTDMMNQNFSEAAEIEKEEDNPKQVDKSPKWFIVKPKVRTNGYCKTRKNFTYDVTYVISVYETPYIRSPYVNYVADYYGPYKLYNYIYTGDNNEILSYEQTYNSLFYLDAADKPTIANTNPPAPVKPNSISGGNSSSQEGIGEETTASVRTSLYSIGDQASARITILGDPDYLTQTEISKASPNGKFYGPDFTIDPNGGQTFIEINFNEVIDYNTKTGVMDLNKQFEVYKYPKYLKDIIKGITYEVNLCTSTFSRGRFTQELSLILWSPPNNDKETAATGTASVDDTSRDDAEMKKLKRQNGEQEGGDIEGFPENSSSEDESSPTEEDVQSYMDSHPDEADASPRTVEAEGEGASVAGAGGDTMQGDVMISDTPQVADDDSAYA